MAGYLDISVADRWSVWVATATCPRAPTVAAAGRFPLWRQPLFAGVQRRRLPPPRARRTAGPRGGASVQCHPGAGQTGARTIVSLTGKITKPSIFSVLAIARSMSLGGSTMDSDGLLDGG